MTSTERQFHHPGKKLNADDEPRQVGFELEFAGLELPQVASILAETLAGEVHPNTHAESEVEVPQLGKFVVELDWEFAKETAKERASQHLEASGLADDPFMEWLTRIASQIVPVEIVCPPITINNLHLLDKAIAALRDAGALGTEESLLYAFGLHINTELPDLEPKTIIAYLKAYAVCQDWLIEAHQVDPVRRITPYIDLYPKDYLLRVLGYANSETMATLIDDYLAFNPTRNRALDMTPLFKHIDEARLVQRLQDSRINSRPTFHYRMPNCSIEQPNWTLRTSWNIWCVIEHLVEHPDQLAQLCTQCETHLNQVIPLKTASWHPELNAILENLESA